MVNSAGIRGPDFFILGAPKCGTSSLAFYLRAHPNIFMSEPKEPNFFCDDLPSIREFESLDDYLTIFADRTEQQTAAGEASTWYLYSTTAASNILQYKSDARMIVMLRNPLDLLRSLHQQFIWNLMEENKSFDTAWKRCVNYELSIMRYDKVGKLGEQIKRLFELVPREQIKIIMFDDFKKDSPQIYKDVLEFLEIPFVNLKKYRVYNQAKKHRFEKVEYFVKHPPKSVLNLVNKLKRLTGISKIGVAPLVRRFNTQKLQTEPLSQEMRSIMTQTFRGDVALLSEQLKMDLSHWLKED